MRNELQILKEGLSSWSFNINDEKLIKFGKYMEMILEWNNRMNLTSITDPNEIVVKHFLDSLSILYTEHIKENIVIMDIGTGAGLPGIPLKIIFPDIRMILVDSLKKRTQFLSEVVEKLDLRNVEIIHARAEDLGKNDAYRESCDLVLSRAVAELRVLAEYCLPFTRVDGFFIAYKGPGAANELSFAKKALSVLGGDHGKIENIPVPFSDRIHQLVIIHKISKTPIKYPRSPGKPKKSPL